MHNSLEIEKKSNGYSVDIASWRDDEYNAEELVFQDPLDVLAEVLRWLGYGDEDVDTVIELLDEDAVYELTDKGRDALVGIDNAQAAQDWKLADQDWEIRRLEAELAALKRGSGHGGYWTGTPTGLEGGTRTSTTPPRFDRGGNRIFDGGSG